MANARSVPIERLRSEYYKESWVWDADNKSPDVLLSKTHQAAYFHTDPVEGSTGAAGVRGSKGFAEGEHYWEVTFLEPPCGASTMVGVGTASALLHTDNYDCIDLLGRDEHSWGLSYKGSTWHRGNSTRFCEPFYEESTVIGIHLNLYTGTLAFYKDGEPLGVAFKGLQNTAGQLYYPIICSTATSTELEVGLQTCRYSSLEEKCYHVVAQHTSKDGIRLLPLPTSVKNHLLELK